MKHRSLLVSSLLGLMILLSASSFGQGMRRSPEERAAQLKEQLSLDSVQTKKVQAIYEGSQKEMMSMMQSGSGDRESMRDAMTKQTEKVDKEIEKLLTKEQMTKYDEVKKQRQQMRRPRGGN